MLGLIFGVTIYAVSAVLTAFMTGLALGSVYFGRRADTHPNPIKIFIYLELGIGIFALLFPLLFQGLTILYVHIHQFSPSRFYISSLIRFFISFILLLFPTILMGGTLPVLSKLFIQRLNKIGWDIGKLYSINNLGAVIGCFTAGFFLIHAIGITATNYCAGFINILIGFTCYLLRNRFKDSKNILPPVKQDTGNVAKKRVKEDSPAPIPYPRAIILLVLWVFAVEGFSALSYEVIWTRILAVFVDETVYFFTTIVISFIFGLSLGSIIVGKISDRKINLPALLGYIEIVIGILAIALLPIFARLPQFFVTASGPTVSWWSSTGMQFLIYFLILLLPTTLMGMTFPIVSKIYTTNLNNIGAKLGNIGFLDTVGSILGSFVAGFIFIPFLGVIKGVIITAFINLFLGAILILYQPFLKNKYKILTGIALFIFLFPAYKIFKSYDFFRYWEMQTPDDKLLYYKEGANATVAVPEHADGVKMLAINGAVTLFAEYGDIRVNKMLGHIPLLLHHNPKNALVIGLGMGVTLHSLLQPYMEELDCVEISPEVIEAVRCFYKENHNVMDDPKVRIILEDGRSYLLITKKKYDIITSNAIHAKLSNSLYTKDFYLICRDKLRENGIMCQWLPTNWMSDIEYKQLIKSFIDVFPYSTLWCVDTGHTILIGTLTKNSLDLKYFIARMNEEKIQDDMMVIDLQNPYDFLAQFVCDETKLTNYLGTVQPNTDNNPYTEFSKVSNKETSLSLIQDLINLKEYPIAVELNSAESNTEIKSERDSLDSYFQSARHYLLSRLLGFYGKGFESIAELQESLKTNPNNGLALYMENIVGKRFIETIQNLKNEGKFDEALNFCRKALEMVPDWSYARIEYGIIENDRGMYDTALNTLKDAVEKNPTIARGYVGLGVVYLNKNLIPEAGAALRKAIQLDSLDFMALFHLGIVYNLEGLFDPALSVLKSAVQVNPDFPAAYDYLGVVYRNKGLFENAVMNLNKAITLDPNFIDARLHLAMNQ